MIKDSGNRREYETGAVRDNAEGKGRCDLMPLDVVAGFFRAGCNDKAARVMNKLYEYQISHSVVLQFARCCNGLHERRLLP